LSADEVVEFHAARLLLLLKLCGTAGRIDGLTKLAKLDFFARYPDFFYAARAATVSPTDETIGLDSASSGDTIESAMIRHHYGPWDKRYYHVLAHLEAKRLIAVSKKGQTYQIALTELGSSRAASVASRPSYASLVERMREVKATFGSKNGAFLKKLIYRLFDEEVGRRRLGEVISK
jgi:hypothetical protein